MATLQFKVTQGRFTIGETLTVKFDGPVQTAGVSLMGFILDTKGGGEDHDVKQIQVIADEPVINGTLVSFSYRCFMADAADHYFDRDTSIARFLVTAVVG